MKNYCVYHIYCVNDWKEVFIEQINLIKSSGLCDFIDKLFLSINYNENIDVDFIVENLKYVNYEIISKTDKNEYEFPALKFIQNLANQENFNVLYLHTKGVSISKENMGFYHNSKNFEHLKNCVNDWRNYMEYFLIENYQDCLTELKVYDACGVNLVDKPTKHFSGNFWWSKSEYIKKLFNLNLVDLNFRWNAEFWIGSGNGNMFSFHNNNAGYKERIDPIGYKKMNIDVIILSYAKNDEIISMNNNCINSINSSTENIKFNIFLIETDSTRKFKYTQENVKVIQPGIEFNYNKFLNIGLKKCKNDWILISNNDTIYHKGFIEKMFDAYNFDNEILSMSPMDDDWKWHKTFDKNIDVFYGYRTSFEVAGWSILINKSVFEKIGEFDEQFSFWYQDNDYANSLIKNNIKHALVTNSKVTHLVSKSHDLIEQEKVFEMTGGLFSTFENKWLKN